MPQRQRCQPLFNMTRSPNLLVVKRLVTVNALRVSLPSAKPLKIAISPSYDLTRRVARGLIIKWRTKFTRLHDLTITFGCLVRLMIYQSEQAKGW
jgi:hypothetical protein